MHLSPMRPQLNNKIIQFIIIVLLFLITAVTYHPFFENGWYHLDDYETLSAGGAGNVIERTGRIVDWLRSEQGRFQPVRLFLFAAFTHLFDEEASVYYNFALHLVNILLLYLLLRKFKSGSVFTTVVLLSFSIFGRWRKIESPSIMMGGSGLNLFLILITLLFLVKTLEKTQAPRRWVYLLVSYAAYASLVFSYEIAFPFFLPIAAVFWLFYLADKPRSDLRKVKEYLYLLPYIMFLIIYFLFFSLSVKGAQSYSGTQIVLSADILIRLKSYIMYTLVPPIQPNIPTKEGAVFLVIYYCSVALALKAKDQTTEPYYEKGVGLRLFLFSVIFYLSTMVLFTINNYETPNVVMVHHTYPMTAAGAIIFVFALFSPQRFFSGRYRKAYYNVLIFLIIPVILLRGVHYNVRFYKDQSENIRSVKLMRDKIRLSVDPEKTDAIIIKNFFHGYYGVLGLNGALLQWFNFKKVLYSGREIVSAHKNEIIFKGPLTYYSPSADKIFKAQNARTEIFYLNEDKTLSSYGNHIDFEKGVNIFQTKQVMGDCPFGGCGDGRVVEAILKGSNNDGFISICFKSKDGGRRFLSSLKTIELNGEPVRKLSVLDDSIVLDIRDFKKDINFFFLKITSFSKTFKDDLKSIGMNNNQKLQ